MDNINFLEKKSQPTKKKWIKGCLIGFVIVIGICFSGFVYFVFGDKILRPIGAQGTIAFISNGDIYLIKPNGKDLQQLTNSEYQDCCPKISPDGQFIAFGSVRDGEMGIYVMDKNGVELGKLSGPVYKKSNINYLWAPDSRQIVYLSAFEIADEYDSPIIENSIYITSIYSQNPELIYRSTSYSWATDLVWSADGKFIYSSDDNSIIRLVVDDGEVEIIDVDFKINQLITISPDGRTLYYEGDPGVIYSVRTDGEDKKFIASSDAGSNICLSANGKYIYYADMSGEIMKVSAKGGEEPRAIVDYRKNQFNTNIVCSPDGKWLAYMQYTHSVEYSYDYQEIRLLHFSNGFNFHVTDFGEDLFWGK